MEFLLNMNLPPSLGERLARLGHSWRHAGEIGLAHAPDQAIVDEARMSGETVVTHDLDYGTLLAFSGERRPSVIILRLRNTSVENLCARIRSAWPDIDAPLREGAIVVIEDAALRIRSLPIARASSD